MKNFKTPKGTDLPVMDLRGKDYLEVKWRIVWFREDHPTWGIETELILLTADACHAKATIKDEEGRIISTSHKYEDAKGFPDFSEKAETGAIGRALALIGYGTQFCADELEEGNRIVDGPIEPKENVDPSPLKDGSQLGEYISPFGNEKIKNKKLKDVMPIEIAGAIEFFTKNAKGPMRGKMNEFHQTASAYLKQIGYVKQDKYKK